MSNQLLDDIIGGDYDDWLDTIIEAVKERRAVLNRRKATTWLTNSSVVRWRSSRR